MAIGDLTQETWSRMKRNLRILEAWVIAGMIGYILTWLALNPTSPAWGVSWSPERAMLMALLAVIGCLPIWVWSTYRYGMMQKWLAEDRGVPYEPGKRYPLWTPKRIVIIALGIALFGISGVVPATTFDLAQFVATFLTVLYGPIEGGIGVGLGFLIIRGPLFTGILNPFLLIAYCLGDGMIYFAAGQFYRQFIYYKPLRYRLTVGLVLYVLFVNFLHVGWGIPGYWWGVVGDYVRYGPLEVSLARRIWRNVYWCPFAWLPNIVIAYLVATAMQRFKV